MGKPRLRHHGGDYMMKVFHLNFIVLPMLNTLSSHDTKHSLNFYGHQFLAKGVTRVFSIIILTWREERLPRM